MQLWNLCDWQACRGMVRQFKESIFELCIHIYKLKTTKESPYSLDQWPGFCILPALKRRYATIIGQWRASRIRWPLSLSHCISSFPSSILQMKQEINSLLFLSLIKWKKLLIKLNWKIWKKYLRKLSDAKKKKKLKEIKTISWLSFQRATVYSQDDSLID